MKALIPAIALLILNLTDGAKEKYKFSYSGEGMNGYLYSEYGCNGMYRYLDFRAVEGLIKQPGIDKPVEESFLTASYSEFTSAWGCGNDVTMKFYQFWDTTPASFDISKNLKSASVSSTARVVVDTYVCDAYFTCEYSSEWVEDGTFTATFVATGTPDRSQSHCTSNSPYAVGHDKHSGTNVVATISEVSFTVGDFTIFSLPDFTYQYGNIYNTKDGYFTMWRNIE